MLSMTYDMVNEKRTMHNGKVILIPES